MSNWASACRQHVSLVSFGFVQDDLWCLVFLKGHLGNYFLIFSRVLKQMQVFAAHKCCQKVGRDIQFPGT